MIVEYSLMSMHGESSLSFDYVTASPLLRWVDWFRHSDVIESAVLERQGEAKN